MALSGLHVGCGFVGAPTQGRQIFALMIDLAWSETLASAGTTTNAAPPIPDYQTKAQIGDGQPCVELYASVDCFVAIGPSPNASTGKRYFLPAATTRNIFCQPGDKVAWTPA